MGKEKLHRCSFSFNGHTECDLKITCHDTISLDNGHEGTEDLPLLLNDVRLGFRPLL